MILQTRLGAVARAVTVVALSAALAISCSSSDERPSGELPNTSNPQPITVDDALRLSATLAADDEYLKTVRAGWCIPVEVGRPPELQDKDIQYNGFKIFDDLTFLGFPSTSAYALETDEGIVLIDSLNSEEEARNVIEPGLRAVGLDPSDVTWIVLTHEHEDHYGGVQYFRNAYGSKLVAGEAAVPTLEEKGISVDTAVRDGDIFAHGGKDFYFIGTTGHTIGTVSPIVEVTDFNGTKHSAAWWGGTNHPQNPKMMQDHLDSSRHYGLVTADHQVDVQLSTHPFIDGTPQRITAMKNDPEMKNPFVLGTDRFDKNADILTACSEAGAIKQTR